MTLPVKLRPEAANDVAAAQAWYDNQRQGLGSEFTDAVDDVVSQIGSEPMLYAISFREVRRCKLRRFPYIVYYRVLAEQIEVLGILHASRDPRTWQKRV